MKPFGSSRRAALKQTGAVVALAPVLGVSALAQAQRAPTLYVFVQSEVKAAPLERALTAKLGGLAITVFGKHRDLEQALSAAPPDALLAAEAVLTKQRIAPAIEGLRSDKSWEPYVLLFLENVTPDSLDGKTVGVVDMLGRDDMQTLVETVLGSKRIKIKRVSKLEDLLSLLLFSAADAVLAGASAAQLIQQRSRLPLKAKEIMGSRLGLPAVGILNQHARENVTRAVLSMDSTLNRMLGIERWRAR